MADVCRTVGVPLIAPVVVLNDKPLGMEGLMAHDVVAPPLMAGVVVVIAVPFSKVKSWALYTMVLGGTSLTVMFRLVVVDPPELLAQTV